MGPLTYPQAITSEGGRFVFAITPGAKGLATPGDEDSVHKGATGICYEVQPDGALKEIWKVTGWFTSFYHLRLDFDGKYLIHIGSKFDRDSKEPLKSLGIAFYNEGKLIKKYSVGDLLKDGRKWDPEGSWLNWEPRFTHMGERQFELVTVDGIHYVFDYSTGEIEITEHNAAGQPAPRPESK